MCKTALSREGTTGWESASTAERRHPAEAPKCHSKPVTIFCVAGLELTHLGLNLRHRTGKAVFPCPGEAESSLKHSPLLLSALSQAPEFPAFLLREALIYLFNGESKQQLEKSVPAFQSSC